MANYIVSKNQKQCLRRFHRYLESPAALLGPIAFIAYITRFQIIPEEILLAQHFAEEFSAYRQRVRRWL